MVVPSVVDRHQVGIQRENLFFQERQPLKRCVSNDARVNNLELSGCGEAEFLMKDLRIRAGSVVRTRIAKAHDSRDTNGFLGFEFWTVESFGVMSEYAGLGTPEQFWIPLEKGFRSACVVVIDGERELHVFHVGRAGFESDGAEHDLDAAKNRNAATNPKTSFLRVESDEGDGEVVRFQFQLLPADSGLRTKWSLRG